MSAGIDEMGPKELLAWANGLGICRFELDGDEVRCEGGNVEIRLDLGEFSESIGGGRFVGFDFEDERDGYRAGSMPCRTLEEAAERIELRAVDLGLYAGQVMAF